MHYSVQMDLVFSVLAFLGLASLIVAYVDYRPRWADYLIFAVIFAIFGLYTGETYGVHGFGWWLGHAICYAIGVVIVLYLKSAYLLHKTNKAVNKPIKKC